MPKETAVEKGLRTEDQVFVPASFQDLVTSSPSCEGTEKETRISTNSIVSIDELITTRRTFQVIYQTTARMPNDVLIRSTMASVDQDDKEVLGWYIELFLVLVTAINDAENLT